MDKEKKDSTFISLSSLNSDIDIQGMGGGDRYLAKMKSRVNDKIDFLIENKEKFNIIIDLGCADGALIFELKQHLPNLYCIGYDIDKEAIGKAKQQIKLDKENIGFFDNKEDLLNFVFLLQQSNPQLKVLVNMSSFLHEIYTYTSDKTHQEILQMISDINPEFIAIRDFHIPDDQLTLVPNLEISKKIQEYFSKIPSPEGKISEKGKTVLEAWNETYQDISKHQGSMMHLLLSSRYLNEPKTFAEREFFENYLSVNAERLKKFQNLSYRLAYQTTYNTNGLKVFLKDEIKLLDVEIALLPSTKIKQILQKKANPEKNLDINISKGSIE